MEREKGITRDHAATGTEGGHGIACHCAFLLVQRTILGEWWVRLEGQHNSDWTALEPKHSPLEQIIFRYQSV